MRKLVSAAGLLLLLPFALMAQETPQAELFTGFSYLRMQKTNNVGWDAAIQGNINKHLGIVGDASGYYNSQTQTVSGVQSSISGSIHSILGGLQVADPAGRWTPYAQALFGWARVHSDVALNNTRGVILANTNSANAFAAKLGGGIDFNLNSSVDIRMIQADYMLIRSNGQKQQGGSISAGLVFRLGKKKQ